MFEGFGPVGERRSRDLGGRPVDATATFPGGGEGDGVPGLAAYIRSHRQADFVENLSRKLLAYALGRELQASDAAAVKAITADLAKNENRFETLVLGVVRSYPFQHRRNLKQDE